MRIQNDGVNGRDQLPWRKPQPPFQIYAKIPSTGYDSTASSNFEEKAIGI
jgi:hypothetical protein